MTRGYKTISEHILLYMILVNRLERHMIVNDFATFVEFHYISTFKTSWSLSWCVLIAFFATMWKLHLTFVYGPSQRKG